MRPAPTAIAAGSLVVGAAVVCIVCYANATGAQAEQPRIAAGAQAEQPRSAAVAPAAQPAAPSPTLVGFAQAGGGQGTAAAAGQDLGAGFASLIAAVQPAVVSILRPGAAQHASPSSGPILVDPYPSQGMRVGAGVLVDSRGFVLTSLQTVGGSTELWVRLSGSRSLLRARRVAEDAGADLVVLRVSADSPLPTLRLGDSDRLKMGDLVLAIGSPFGFNNAVTTGIVASNHRRLWLEGRLFEDLIQTDAQLNPGNAGGPLINIDGEVVGIAVGMLAVNSTSVGIGFAVASNRARALLRDL